MKMNKMEMNLEKMEMISGGDIYDAIRKYNEREQMKKDYILDERRRFQEMLKTRRFTD